MSSPRPAPEGLRLLVIGNSGTGKSTLTSQLKSICNIPNLSLDTVFHRPGWVPMPADEMRAHVGEFIEKNTSWIIDGNYFGKVGTLTLDHATHIIWLDPPFWRYYPRLILRTIRRYLGLEETCSPGCVERFREFYAADGLLRWAWHNHNEFRQQYGGPIANDPRLVHFSSWFYTEPLQKWVAKIALAYGQPHM